MFFSTSEQNRSASCILHWMPAFTVTLLIFSVLSFGSVQSKKWVGTWSCAPYAAGTNTPPSPYLANNTLRQIIRVSIGGDTLRVKFSNGTSSTPVTMNSVNIAVSTEVGGSAADLSTMKQLKFSGDTSVTMNAYSAVTSDPLAFPLSPGMHLAITIYYGQITQSSEMTFHYGSRTDSYILAGNRTASASFDGATPVERWYTINAIDVLAPDTSAAVVVLGNSITDGYGLHGGLKNKWTDTLSERLLDNPATSHVGVLNMGIGATLFTTSGVGRFQQDVLDQSGVRWVIIFYGVNDIGGNVSAANIISAYENTVAWAHAQNVRVYGATITPINGSQYYSASHEAVRVEVNQWIRTAGHVDRCIDFDRVIRNPAEPTRLMAAYSNDWLHPNVAGYRLLGESVDLNLFLGGDTLFPQPDTSGFRSYYFETECGSVGSNWDIINDSQSSNGKYVTVKAGIQSLEQAPAGDANSIMIPFTVDTTDIYSLYARLNCSTYDDDSFWIKMDNGGYAMNNGLVTSGWGWVNLGDYSLTEGDHTLIIGDREDGALLDKIAVSNADFAPVGMGEEVENLCTGTGMKDSEQTPAGFSLAQNYPNPFNPDTVIEYDISRSGRVKIALFDISGKKISDIVNEMQTAGKKNQCEFGSPGHRNIFLHPFF
jgi:lysophospholipase L1-like esterase